MTQVYVLEISFEAKNLLDDIIFVNLHNRKKVRVYL